jgi:RNA polymerase sigma-B factor
MTTMATEPAFLRLLEAYRAGDESAREQIVEQYMPLVRKIASRYAGRGEPSEDLVQVGSIGLVLAIERFDVERGVKFTTYAVPTIVGEIQRHFRDRAWAVHVPRRMKELSLKLARTIETATADLGRAPTIAELAADTGLEEEEVVEALETYNAYSTRSLSQPLGLGDSDEGTVEDLFGAPEEGYDEVEHGVLLESGLAALDDRERAIIELRFFEGLTQSEIAARIGISQMHVSRLLRRSLAVMRGRLEGAVTEQEL